MRQRNLGPNTKTIGISQSNYIPWWGYFYLISKVHVFVFYDNVQFTKNDWRNRNILSSNSSPHWLAIPVGQSINRAINEVTLPQGNWRRKHLNFVKMNYSKFQYFDEIFSLYQDTVLDKEIGTLSQLNQSLIMDISKHLLDLNTTFVCSSIVQKSESPTRRLVSCIQALEGETYISAPAGRNYLDEELFRQNSIKLEFLEYPQNYLARFSASPESGASNLSIIDTYSRFGKNIFLDSGELK